MTSLSRTAGAAANLVNALWGAYLSLVAMNTPRGCPSNGCPPSLISLLPAVLLAVCAILVIDAMICFFGLRFGFLVGAIVSAGVAVLVGIQWGTFGNFNSGVAVSLSALAILLDVVSTRARRGFSEEMHPLNLPVFG